MSWTPVSPYCFAPIFSFHLILIRFPSYLRYPYSFTLIHLSRWFLSTFLLIPYYFTFGYVHCPLHSPTLLCHSLIQPNSFLLLCLRQLLILCAASRSFLVSIRQHDSSRPLTLYDSAFTVEYIRLRVLIVFPQFDLFVNTTLYLQLLRSKSSAFALTCSSTTCWSSLLSAPPLPLRHRRLHPCCCQSTTPLD
jgi:hypothetical protein